MELSHDKLPGSQLAGNFLAQQFLKRVYQHFKEAHSDECAVKETSKLLGVSERSVFIYKDSQANVPRNAYKRKFTVTKDIRPEMKQEIRHQIYAMHNETTLFWASLEHGRKWISIEECHHFSAL